MGQEDSPERGEAMDEKRWEQYLNEVLSFVKFKYDHKAIRRELAEHMADLKEELMTEGVDKDAAEYMAVEYMGDAAEIGRELDQEHHALLGWVWQISRVLAILMVIVTLVPMYYKVGSMIGNIFERYEPPEGVTEVWQRELDREYQIYDDRLMLDTMHLYDDGTLVVVYRTTRPFFAESIGWSMGISLAAFDENGEKLGLHGGGYKKGGLYGLGYEKLKGFSDEGKTVNIYCSDLVITVDMATGEVTDNAET